MRQQFWLMTITLVVLTWLAACTGPTPETITEVVKETVVVEKEVVTEKEVVVTATPVPAKQGGVFVEAGLADIIYSQSRFIFRC